MPKILLGLMAVVLMALLALTMLDEEQVAEQAALAQGEKPNFIVIVADDLSANDVSFFKRSGVKTPTLEKLARRGMVFDQAFLTTSSCSASRASLLSGRYPIATGAPDLHGEMSAEIPTIASELKNAGYYTAAIGKWHLGQALTAHFDRVFDGDDDSGSEHWVTELKNRAPDQPFFFWLAPRDPHIPYSPLTPDQPYQADNAKLTPFMPDTIEARVSVAQYANEIARLDQAVANVIAELERQHQLENTYIIFLSDNGAPFPRSKTTLYDLGLQTPLLIAGPGVQRGVRNKGLTSVIDLVPTIAELAGIPANNSFQGKSIAPRLQNYLLKGDQQIFAEQHKHGYDINKRAVRTDDFLYIRAIGHNRIKCLLEVQPMGKQLVEAFRAKKATAMQTLCFGKQAEEELYAAGSRDPWQISNLADKPKFAAEKAKLKQLMDQQAKHVGDDRYQP